MAIRKGSRYEQVAAFAREPGGQRVFEGTRPRAVVAPSGVLEHVVKAGERLDLLALHYYNDVRRWWRILDANPHIFCAADLPLDRYEGTTLLIPRATDPRR